MTYFLIANGEFPLRLLVLLGILVEFLERVVAQHRLRELDVALGVLVAWENSRVVGQAGQRLVERLVHFRGRAFEEAATAADEKRVAGKHGTVLAVLEEETYAVLRVAGRVQRRYFDGTDVES